MTIVSINKMYRLNDYGYGRGFNVFVKSYSSNNDRLITIENM